MASTWGSTDWGKIFTTSIGWRLTLAGHAINLEVSGAIYDLHLLDAKTMYARPGVIWAAIVIGLPDGRSLTLDGIANHDARVMLNVIRQALIDYNRKRQPSTVLS